MKLKNFLIGLLTLGVAGMAAPFVYAVDMPEGTVRLEVFERQDCAHCQAEKKFLEDLQEQRGDMVIIYHDIADIDQKEHFITLTELEGIPKVTPITIIDGNILQGFATPKTTGKRIESLIDSTKGKPQYSFEEFVAMGGSKNIESVGETCELVGDVIKCDTGSTELWVDVPFVGEVDIAQYSLPAMATVLGFVDGFNPCAMWVLVLFLTILMEAGSRRRMFEMAGLFILAEAVMYYLILTVWMTAWDFVGLDNIVTPIVGTVAVGAGVFFLYNFYKADTSCNVGSLASKKKTTDMIRHYATVPMTWVTALGILALAFSVNIIEFACSVGIPQTYTKILDINYLTWGGKQFYNAIYIFMYMIDDLVVFALALYSFDKIGLTTAKYTRASHLIGGTVMIILGLILLIKPTLLVFG